MTTIVTAAGLNAIWVVGSVERETDFVKANR